MTGFTALETFLLNKKPSSIVVLSDTTVFSLYGDPLLEFLKSFGIKSLVSIVLDPGEISKNLETVKTCWEEMYREGIDRHSLVIGFGGGAVTDIAGFVASCYMRGLDVVYIPTTLMGMVDAAWGGKNGINLQGGKNIVGSILQPELVLVEPSYLQSLPEREFVSGLAEIVKYGIIADPTLFERLEETGPDLLTRNSEIMLEIIQKCCNLKNEIVQKDEKDKGLRAILNLGHTFAHAIEAATNFSIYLHGEAVAIGLSCAFYLSFILGMAEENLIFRLHDLLKKLNLPTALPDIPPPENLIEFMYRDKKTVHGQINLIAVEKIGSVKQLFNVEPELILKALIKKQEDEHLLHLKN